MSAHPRAGTQTIPIRSAVQHPLNRKETLHASDCHSYRGLRSSAQSPSVTAMQKEIVQCASKDAMVTTALAARTGNSIVATNVIKSASRKTQAPTVVHVSMQR